MSMSLIRLLGTLALAVAVRVETPHLLAQAHASRVGDIAATHPTSQPAWTSIRQMDVATAADIAESFPPLLPHEYVGQKVVVFRPEGAKPEDSIRSLTDAQDRHPTIAELGEQVTVVRVDADDRSLWVVGSNGNRYRSWLPEHGKLGFGVLRRTVETATRKWQGRDLWARNRVLKQGRDGAADVKWQSIVPGTRLTVTKIEPSQLAGEDLRFWVKTQAGVTGYFDVSMRAKTVHDDDAMRSDFTLMFTTADPRLVERWSDETWRAIEQEQVIENMTREQLYYGLGKPLRCRRVGDDEQLLYWPWLWVRLKGDIVSSWGQGG